VERVRVAEYRCDRLQDGLRCRRYVHVHGFWRFLASLIGAGVAVLPGLAKALSAYSHGVPAPILPYANGLAVLWFLAGAAGVAFAWHHEDDFLGCLVTGFGIPGLLYALILGVTAEG
jgi:hypothetical protein